LSLQLTPAELAALAAQSSLGVKAAECLVALDTRVDQLKAQLESTRQRATSLEHLLADHASAEKDHDAQRVQAGAARAQLENLASAVRDLLRDSAATMALSELGPRGEAVLERLQRHGQASSGSALLALLSVLRKVLIKLGPDVVDQLPPGNAALIWEIAGLSGRHWLDDYVDRYTALAETLVAVRAAVADVEAGRPHDPASTLKNVVDLVKPAVRYAVGEKVVVRLRLAEAACAAVIDAGEAINLINDPAVARVWESALAWHFVARRHAP
jgi:hypothetical protein